MNVEGHRVGSGVRSLEFQSRIQRAGGIIIIIEAGMLLCVPSVSAARREPVPLRVHDLNHRIQWALWGEPLGHGLDRDDRAGIGGQFVVVAVRIGWSRDGVRIRADRRSERSVRNRRRLCQ